MITLPKTEALAQTRLAAVLRPSLTAGPRIAPPSLEGNSSWFYPQAKHKLNGNCKEGGPEGASRKEGIDEPGGDEADQDSIQ